MPSKPPITAKEPENKKSIIVIPNKVATQPAGFESVEETEIAAQLTIPYDGKWGWVVVVAAFWSIFILDGVAYTFGSVINEITQEFGIEESLIALVNSIAIALYSIAGPLSSGFINRFGFRACIMTGSVIVSSALFITYFATSYTMLCIFYGVVTGFGYCLVNVSSALVVGFYFEKHRAIALAIATTGSSIGISIMYPLNKHIAKIAGWRVVILLQSALFGMIYFLGMTFRPLLSLTVSKTTEDPTKTVTYLPSVAAGKSTEGLVSTKTEKLFGAVSNINFPTAAAVLEEGIPATATKPGPSTATVSKLTLTANTPQGGISQRQLKQVRSILSRTSVPDKNKRNLELTVNVEEKPKKKSCWGRLCSWEKHIPQSRPMYKDDAFYDGKLERLPVYQKSKLDTSTEAKTGLEYQMAVTRTASTADLEERRGIWTTAIKRVLVTMVDPQLLKRCSFLVFCSSAFFLFLGNLVPYVFLQDRNELAGIDPKHCALFITVIGFANAIGRLAMGLIAYKIEHLKLFSGSIMIAGISTMLSNFWLNMYFQYTYCCIYGFCTASIACLRCMVLVNLYGLDMLTNAVGMMLIFQGVGSLLCTPIASILKEKFGYAATFYSAGAVITVSGACLIPVTMIRNREELKDSRQKQDTPSNSLITSPNNQK